MQEEDAVMRTGSDDDSEHENDDDDEDINQLNNDSKKEIQESLDLLEKSNQTNFQWPEVFRIEKRLPDCKSKEDSLKWVLENRSISIRTITWNLCAQPPPSASVLKQSQMFQPNRFHLFIIGTEECERSIAQSAINTSKKLWEAYLMEVLGPCYLPIRSHTLQAIHVICFAHESVAHLITDISSAAVATGVQNTLGNKGGVSLYMKIHNKTFLFTNAHFAAGQNSVTRRNKNFQLINKTTCKKLFSKANNRRKSTSPSRRPSSNSEFKSESPVSRNSRIRSWSTVSKTNIKDSNNSNTNNNINNNNNNNNNEDDEFNEMEEFKNDNSSNNNNTVDIGSSATLDECADHVIFMGDLNYRINGERKMIMKLLEKRMHEVLLNNDQLRKSIDQHLAFASFTEPPLNFPPTYKFDIGTDDYDTGSKKRSPAWTDRILYIENKGLECFEYCSEMSIKSSDHRPVYASFIASIADNNSSNNNSSFYNLSSISTGSSNSNNEFQALKTSSIDTTQTSTSSTTDNNYDFKDENHQHAHHQERQQQLQQEEKDNFENIPLELTGEYQIPEFTQESQVCIIT